MRRRRRLAACLAPACLAVAARAALNVDSSRSATLLRELSEVWEASETMFSFPESLLLASQLRSTDTLLEWGAGHSTLWLARHVSHVYAFESEAVWHMRLTALLGIPIAPHNVNLTLVPPTPAAVTPALASLPPGLRFDRVVVDGPCGTDLARELAGAGDRLHNASLVFVFRDLDAQRSIKSAILAANLTHWYRMVGAMKGDGRALLTMQLR